MTTRVLSGLVLTAVLATLSPGCGPAKSDEGGGKPSVAPKWGKASHALVFISVTGRKQALIPDKAYIWIGAGAEPTREVWWLFVHKKAEITFKDPNPLLKTTCKSAGKISVCILVLSKDSLLKGTYPYSVTGEDDNGPLDPIDPEIEIDR
ncbi:MAG: hypothetical protein PT977_08860 [Acidobacteriota bacterium]|nr:hypothetical protein [Acidobacteriota bacterium]